MKQTVENLRTGIVSTLDVPSPSNSEGHLVICTRKSLISAGTEKMLLEFGKAGWLEKARKQPERVKAVTTKIVTDGLFPTVSAVLEKLDRPMPLGYCNVGTVVESNSPYFSKGQRVVSNGSHAEMVRVSENLCVIVPDTVDDNSAAFTVLGAIALQGIRLVAPQIGERVAVFGLGLIGLLTVQLLKANGCKVIGFDVDRDRCELAKGFDAEACVVEQACDPVSVAMQFTGGCGIDAVLITASAESSELISQAAKMSRKRGRIVLVGQVGLNLNRDDFYEKELTFQVSCSYGPGRYDPRYEEKGLEYPIGFVRWTVQRNFQAFLELLEAGSVDVAPLISYEFSIDDVAEAYDQLESKETLAILLAYPKKASYETNCSVGEIQSNHQGLASKAVVGVIGCGNYASRELIPAFAKSGAELKVLMSAGGLSAGYYGKKFGFTSATTRLADITADETVNTAVIATRHHQHANQVISAISAGMHVFVEKPLCLTEAELSDIKEAYYQTGGRYKLMVGYNRRFAPLIVSIKSLLDRLSAPKSVLMTMNAGIVAHDHWTRDLQIGGGRFIGEGCHYVDLMRHLIGHPIVDVRVTNSAGHVSASADGSADGDNVIISLRFSDGSMGSINYMANGGNSFPKERIEIFANNGVLQLDNFRRLKVFGWKGLRSKRLFKQDKGQTHCVSAFVNSIECGSESPIDINEIFEVAGVMLAIDRDLRMH